MPLAAAKGWSYGRMAGCFTLFAATKVVASLVIGPWLDWVGPVRLIAASVPLLAEATAVLALGRAPLTGAVGYFLAGLIALSALPVFRAIALIPAPRLMGHTVAR